MGKKRRADEGLEGGRENQQHALHHPQKRFRPQVSGDSESRSLTAIRADIKNLGWQLEKLDSLPADARVEKERQLAHCRVELDDGLAKQQRKRMISRYHMVRFFERQRATRALKRHRKALEAVEPSSADYENRKAAVYEAEVDLNYALFYPLAEKYISLYPKSAEQDSEAAGGIRDRKVGSERPPLWFLVERAMKEGKLEELRDGKGKQLAFGKPKARASGRHDQLEAGKDSSTAKKKMAGRGLERLATAKGHVQESLLDNDDDQSDGGFFET